LEAQARGNVKVTVSEHEDATFMIWPTSLLASSGIERQALPAAWAPAREAFAKPDDELIEKDLAAWPDRA
jgi:hypothetical protein